MPELSETARQRYARQIVMPEIGEEGQARLLAARVLLVGAGGLGSPIALYLAAAGVGTLGLVEYDQVDLSNLNRQILHRTRDVGRPKIESAVQAISELNPEVRVIPYPQVLTPANALALVGEYDLVVGATDNFISRYLLNDACVLAGKVLVDGSIYRTEGQTTVYDTRRGPCYRCLFPKPPPTSATHTPAESGVLGVVPGVIGCIQAAETLKLILGGGEPLIGRLLLFDAWGMEFRELTVQKNPRCALCGPEATIRTLVDYESFCGASFPQANRDEDQKRN